MYNPYVTSTPYQSNLNMYLNAQKQQELMEQDRITRLNNPDAFTGIDQSLSKPELGNDPSKKSVDYSGVAKGVGIGLQSYENAKATQTDFDIDPLAGFKGSLTGGASGGTYGAIGGGVGAQIGQYEALNENLDKLNTSVDAYGAVGGNPYYKGSNFSQAFNDINSLESGYGSIKDNQLLYALTGLGATSNIADTLFGSSKKIRKKQRALESSVRTGQRDFNTAESEYQAQQNAMSDYNRLSNRYRRMNNLYL